MRPAGVIDSEHVDQPVKAVAYEQKVSDFTSFVNLSLYAATPSPRRVYDRVTAVLFGKFS